MKLGYQEAFAMKKDAYFTFYKTPKIDWQNIHQSSDFDSQVAHITMPNIACTILAFKKRFTDYESLGKLFRGKKSEILVYTLVEEI